MKTKILLIIALLIALIEGARGQIYVDSYRFGVAAGLLLDDYPNAAGAYSLRLLDKDYTGNCIMVRRSSNGDSTNIGFVNNYLDTATLKTFCSGTNCFVRVWYDQSGNARNVRQTTDASQPKIISGGATIITNGYPTLEFASHFLNLPNAMMTSNHGLFILYRDNGTNTGSIIGQWASGQTNRLLFSANQNDGGSTVADSLNLFIDGTTDGSASSGGAGGMGDMTLSATSLILITSVATTGTNNWKTYRNNIFHDDATIPASIYNGVNTSIGSVSAGTNTNTLNGYITEMIFYQTDQSSNRSNINTNINTFYSIY